MNTDNQTTEWSDIATSFVNTWTETGTQMWKSWFDLMGAVPNPSSLHKIQPEVQNVTKRFLDNRELLVRFLKISVDAWKDIFPKVQTGDNWQDVLMNYTQQMQQQLNDFTTSYLKIGKDTGELWQLYIQEMQNFSQLWLDPLGLSMGTMSKAVTGHSSALIELNNLYWNLLYEETFGSLMQSPILGPTREFSGKLLSGFEAWRNLYQASVDYQIILADIQVRSFEALMKKLVSLAEKGEQVKDWKHFQQLWSEVADDVFADAFCQEDNLKIRGKFLNALNSYRIQQQELMELSMKMMNMPLRSEVDEIHHTIYELRKEVKSLKKKLAKYEANQTKSDSNKPDIKPTAITK